MRSPRRRWRCAPGAEPARGRGRTWPCRGRAGATHADDDRGAGVDGRLAPLRSRRRASSTTRSRRCTSRCAARIRMRRCTGWHACSTAAATRATSRAASCAWPSEDIGNADPRALTMTLEAWQAYERLGSPEGELALAQAVVFLACAAKSNAVYTACRRRDGRCASVRHPRGAAAPAQCADAAHEGASATARATATPTTSPTPSPPASATSRTSWASRALLRARCAAASRSRIAREAGGLRARNRAARKKTAAGVESAAHSAASGSSGTRPCSIPDCSAPISIGVRANLARRGFVLDTGALSRARGAGARPCRSRSSELRSERNAHAKEHRQGEGAGRRTSRALLAEVEALGDELAELETELDAVQARARGPAARPAQPAARRACRTAATRPPTSRCAAGARRAQFDFEPRDHVEIGEQLACSISRRRAGSPARASSC